MDASASVTSDAQFNNLYSVYVLEKAFPTADTQKSSVIKYTRLPEFDYNSFTEQWPKNNYTMEPRLRRIIAIEEPLINTTRSLKTNMSSAPKMASTGYSKRKIVTIEEDEEKSLHPKFSREGKHSSKMINRAIETGSKDQKLTSQRTSRLTTAKYFQDTKDTKQIVRANSLSNSRKNTSVTCKKYKQAKENDPVSKAKESLHNIRTTQTSSKNSLSKKLVTPTDSGKEIQIIRNKLKEDIVTSPLKKISPKEKIHKTSPEHGRLKSSLLKELCDRKKPLSIIHVPLEKAYKNQDLTSQISNSETEINSNVIDCSADVDNVKILCDANVGTESPKTMDQITETICNFTEISHTTACDENRDKITFDSLKIPNVTLIKDKVEESKENLVSICSQSLPNLRVPTINVAPKDNDLSNTCFHKSTSYIISRATLTYTTKQKINFHVVENKIDMNLAPAGVTYPMNVLSVYKKEHNIEPKRNTDETNVKEDRSHEKHTQRTETSSVEAVKTHYVRDFERNKLIKPSDIISSINAKNSLLPNDYINEQFQRELNFIDSFFESLQYLENCSLSDKRLMQSNVEDLVSSSCDLKKLEYDSFFTKLGNAHIVDDNETIASKSLCLLNLLIRDEQRRAKNLLFVLKMREDALIDFTKSQLLWFENRKKQDNTDISTLKKKQRGALLKLQHEYGEMQRMRKALLTLSEKRKGALMRTKRNIELKYKNHVDVEQIMEKRKLKRSPSTDRHAAPLKCFDLSSSGCEESTTSRSKSVTPHCMPKPVAQTSSAEKCIQTGDSVLSTTTVNQSTSTTDENFVVVDGGYLNILFQNLTLPEIFSNGKQYEVNEEALRNIVTTTNHKANAKEGDIVKSFMDQVKSHELERSSSPSTARSLVEELDQYYKGLNVEDKPLVSSMTNVREVKDIGVQIIDEWNDSAINSMKNDTVDVSAESNDRSVSEPLMVSVETQCTRGREESVSIGSVAGPLPVPAGEAAVTDSSMQDQLTWPDQKSSTSSSPGESSSAYSPVLYPSVSSLVTPAQNEAEELRRQQLAIEREIKALEQQQCQLLVVREIPDKPPPPYTPPLEIRTPKPKKFSVDATSKDKVGRYIAEAIPEIFDEADPFDAFLKDYCQETLDRQKKEQGDKFWHTCHDIPPKKQLKAEKLVHKTNTEIKEVLTSVTPTVVSGVGARRSDHIDDILFAEWRRCEPEWTSLHTDEVIVKNQIFESIFQKILTETVDEYKKSVILKRNEMFKAKSIN